MKQIILKLISFLKKIFIRHIEPVIKGEPTLNDVKDNYVAFDYKGQTIVIRKEEIPLWNKLTRTEKREMARKLNKLQKKGTLKLVETENQKLYVKNRDNENNGR